MRESVHRVEVGPHAATRARERPKRARPPGMQRRVLGLAGPVVGENFLETLLGIVDTLLVAQIGAAAIAGVGSALQVMFFLIAALSALSIGSSVLVAQAIGAGDHDRASRLSRQSLLWGAFLSLPLALVGLLFAPGIISLYGVEPDVAQIGTDYLRVTMGTVVVMVALFTFRGIMRGIGDSRTPMLITAVANVLNVVLSYVLIYGAAGLPALGAVGSAWGTFIARAIALALLCVVLWRGRAGVTIGGRAGWRPDSGVAMQVLRLGVPAAVEQVLISAAFFVLTIVVASLGTSVLAAHRITFTALSFSFLPGIGFGLAATALVGQSIGAGRIDEGASATRIATAWAVGWMGAIMVLLLIFAEPIMRVFSSDPAVVAAGAAGLRVVALAQPFWAVLFVQSGALRGTGNTSFPLLVTGTSMWVATGLAYLLIALFGGSLVLIWLAFLVTAPLVALAVWWRFRVSVAALRATLVP